MPSMMELPESLRALYFAPVPLVMLTHTRHIRMINKSAEAVLGIPNAKCAGHWLERFIDPESRASYGLALNEASKTSAASSGSANPVATRLQLNTVGTQSAKIWAEFSITAWFPNDAISPDADLPPVSPLAASGASAETRSSSFRAPHEALYTITVIPAKTGVSEVLTSPPTASTTADSQPPSTESGFIDSLSEAVLNNIDMAVMALSKDGKREIRNRACEEMFASFTGMSIERYEELHRADQSREEGTDPLLPKFVDTMLVYDENFTRALQPSEWPLIKAAFLGQTLPRMTMGIQVKETGHKFLIELTTRAVRDQSGYGEHIGGVCCFRNITTERLKVKMEAEMQGDMHFRQIVDLMPQLVWVAGPTGFISWYSRSYCSYTGLSMEELEGAGWQAILHEDDLAEAGRCWSEALRNESRHEVAFRMKRHDGVYRWFLGRAQLLRDPTTGEIAKWYGTCTDIHDQVEALSASKQTQAQLQSVISHAAVTLWAVNREGIISIAEGPGARQLKLSNASYSNGTDHSAVIDASSVVGKSIYTVWDFANPRESIQKALQGETVVEEMEVDGTWFRTSYTPLRAQGNEVVPVHTKPDDDINVALESSEGEVIGVVGASMDITDRKRAQRQMEESLLEKTRALAAEGAAREASRLKSEFLANMSHEIRTPLAGIIGLSELLLEEKSLHALHREYTETIQRSAEGLLTVLNDVLDFSKVDIGKLDVEQVPFNLVVLLQDFKRMLSFATQKKGLIFKECFNLHYKGALIGDLGRLRQVITNLLTNAIKFTSEGQISLEVTEMPSNDLKTVIIRFDIKDTGCGIHTEALSRLFHPFSQADASTARRFGGTGLGLSISKNLVELMHGKIGLDSTEGRGSHAWFTIPFLKAGVDQIADDILSVKRARIESPGQPISPTLISGGMPIDVKNSLSRPRKEIWILIAEDNSVNAQIASRNVEKMGFSCRVAENGLVALRELERQTYDIVLMDCQMPECDGYEATRMIRSSSNVDIRTLPVIALTASAIIGDRERALKAGMVDYLSKPVKRPALEGVLCKWLFDWNARQVLANFLPMTHG